MLSRRRATAAVIVILAASAAAAAAAFGRGGTADRTGVVPRRPHVDVASLGTKRGVPSDPVARARMLRQEVITLSAVGYITPAQARKALREIRETGTLGRSTYPVPLKVAALSALPPQAHPPAEVARFVAHVGELTGSGPADPASARLLRSNLGKSGTDVYGVRSAAGSPCFIATGYGGTCAGSANVARSGVAWIVGGDHDGLPGIFVGLAADDVRSVRLTVNGAAVPVTLESNVAFAELPQSAQSGVVTTTRAGGRTSSETIPIVG